MILNIRDSVQDIYVNTFLSSEFRLYETEPKFNGGIGFSISRHHIIIRKSKVNFCLVPVGACRTAVLKYFMEPPLDSFLMKLPISSQDCTVQEINLESIFDETNRLRQLLADSMFGRILLQKSEKSEKLNAKERAFIARVVVEAELLSQAVPKFVKAKVWAAWAKEVTDIFKAESSEMYFSLKARTGLFTNRLSNHRRELKRHLNIPSTKKRKSISGDAKGTYQSVRRGASECPDELNPTKQPITSKDLEWLKKFTSPEIVVSNKWRATLQDRLQILKCLSDQACIASYIESFPALKQQFGLKLVSCSNSRPSVCLRI